MTRMRRIVVICASFLALAAPATAWALHVGPNDGTLVVRNGTGPAYANLPLKQQVPAVELQINGAALGHVDNGKIVIADQTPNDAASPVVTPIDSPLWHRDLIDNAQVWSGTNFKFRAVGKYTILIYGSGIDVVAVGHGTVSLTGLPDMPTGDGTYALNGADPRSLPGVTTKPLTIGVSSGLTG